MALHQSTFEYLQATDAQKDDMRSVREAAADYATALDTLLPEGPDKTYCLRLLRTVNMWAMVALTRNPDGSART